MSLLTNAREFYSRRQFKPYAIDKDADGTKLKFWIGDSEGESWYGQSKTDGLDHEMDFLLKNVVSPDDVVFECGAHHGWTTMVIASRLKKGRLVAFEPNRGNYKILQKNIELNSITNVTTVWAAIAATTGKTRIYEKSNGSVVPPLFSRAIISKRMLNVIYGVAEVPTISLDEYARSNGITPTLLKIDVEGFECKVLEGATEILAKRPKLIIEIHAKQLPLYGGSVERVLALTGLHGYRTWLQLDPEKAPVEVDKLTADMITDRVHVFAVPR